VATGANAVRGTIGNVPSVAASGRSAAQNHVEKYAAKHAANERSGRSAVESEVESARNARESVVAEIAAGAGNGRIGSVLPCPPSQTFLRKARKSLFRSQRNRWARKGRASRRTSHCRDGLWFTCRRWNMSASRVRFRRTRNGSA